MADLAVILVAPTRFEQIGRTVQAIAAQTIAHRIELVLVLPEARLAEGREQAFRHFATHRILAVGRIDNVDHAAARGLLAAEAPIVASIEDHAYPEPEWAEALLAEWAADPDAVAIGSAILNANPANPLSWSNALIAYGQWSETTRAGPIDWIAMHNGSFRRAALEPHGEALPALFNRDSDILVRLKAAGGRFRFAPSARIRHLNPSRLASTARLRMDAGRLFAANRAEAGGWGFARRLAYAALGPAIPFLRYMRMRRDLFAGTGLSEIRLGLPLLVGLAFDAIGQSIGNLRGPGAARDRLATFEMDRMEHLDARDRAAFAPLVPRA
jgi:hypothetical protein